MFFRANFHWKWCSFGLSFSHHRINEVVHTWCKRLSILFCWAKKGSNEFHWKKLTRKTPMGQPNKDHQRSAPPETDNLGFNCLKYRRKFSTGKRKWNEIAELPPLQGFSGTKVSIKETLSFQNGREGNLWSRPLSCGRGGGAKYYLEVLGHWQVSREICQW